MELMTILDFKRGGNKRSRRIQFPHPDADEGLRTLICCPNDYVVAGTDPWLEASDLVSAGIASRVVDNLYGITYHVNGDGSLKATRHENTQYHSSFSEWEMYQLAFTFFALGNGDLYGPTKTSGKLLRGEIINSNGFFEERQVFYTGALVMNSISCARHLPLRERPFRSSTCRGINMARLYRNDPKTIVRTATFVRAEFPKRVRDLLPKKLRERMQSDPELS